MRSLLEQHPLLRIGEIGLDKSGHHRHTFALQKQVFHSQLALALELNRSVSVHCVRAHGTLLDMLRDASGGPAAILLHSYSGSVDVTRALLLVSKNCRLYFGVSARINLPLLLRNNCALLLALPRDRIVIESDLAEDDPNRVPALLHAAHELAMPLEELRANLCAFLSLHNDV